MNLKLKIPDEVKKGWTYLKRRVHEAVAETNVMGVVIAIIICFSRNMIMNYDKPAIVDVDLKVLKWAFLWFFGIVVFKGSRIILQNFFARRATLKNDEKELLLKKQALDLKDQDLSIKERELQLAEFRKELKKAMTVIENLKNSKGTDPSPG